MTSMALNGITIKKRENAMRFNMDFDAKTNILHLTSETEIRNIIRSLDFYSRIWIGQYLEIDNEMIWLIKKTYDDVRENEIIPLFLQLRNRMMPASIRDIGQTLYASYGIFSDKVDERAGTAYDMQQVIRYTLAWFLHPEGGWTVDFGSPLRAGRVYPVPKASCTKNDKNIEMDVFLSDKSQFTIIENAIKILDCVYSENIEQMFSYYTDDKDALAAASEIEKIYKMFS